MGVQRDAADTMDKVIPVSTRIWNQQEYIVSVQHEIDVIGIEQEETQH